MTRREILFQFLTDSGKAADIQEIIDTYSKLLEICDEMVELSVLTAEEIEHICKFRNECYDLQLNWKEQRLELENSMLRAEKELTKED